MKNLLYLLLVFWSFSSCQCQNKKASNFMKSLGDGYYSIPNKVGDKLILFDYQNYKNCNDSIFLEKILYLYEKDKLILVIGNIMGSKSSVVLVLEKNNEKYNLLFADETAYIDTIEKTTIKDYTFFLLNSHHADMCSEWEGLTIYILDNLKLYKSFEGLRKEEFYNTGDPVCQMGVSYTQNFDLKFDNNKIVLIVNKKSAEKKSELKKYSLINYQFK
jgi:hypothetical protein